MKKSIFIGPVILFTVLYALSTANAQHMGQGVMQDDGRGMMGSGGMHGSQGMGQQYSPQYRAPGYKQPQAPVNEKDVRGLLENYLKSMRNPNLKLGKITDKGGAFEAEILTKEGPLVDKIMVDKSTGWMRSIY
ncbi:hypothetical protein ACFL9T_06385 [Thermodesulfobacteriota bacterium]